MAPNGPPQPRSSRCPEVLECRTDRVVVWVRGDHDVSTAAMLGVMLARAVTVDDSDLVVDLSGLTFMDASTIGVIAHTRVGLQRRERSLVLRSPPEFARMLLGVCGMADLIAAEPDAPAWRPPPSARLKIAGR